MQRKYRIAHIFCGMGGKGLGAAASVANVGDHEAVFETIGGIDFDPLACADFEKLVKAPALELAVLQSFPAVFDGVPLVLAGKGHTRWREAIGNAVPPKAATKIGNQLLRALLLSTLGLFELDNNDIWVAPHQGAMVA